jgi:insertion element IS1 protein InsB
MALRVCPKCQSHHRVNNGSIAGTPQKRCQPYGDQVTRTTPRGKPRKTKLNAVRFDLRGFSRHHLACRLRVSAQAVLTWIRAGAKEHDEKLAPTGRTCVLEPDERWHDLQHKRQTRWRWNARDRDPGQLLDGECGRRDTATVQKLVDRLAPWEVKVYGPDTWATFASVIPQDHWVQRTATPHDIERHHCRQRHGFGRFTRQSIMVSKSKEMVQLTIALFAKFWVNGNQDELVSLLA